MTKNYRRGLLVQSLFLVTSQAIRYMHLFVWIIRYFPLLCMLACTYTFYVFVILLSCGSVSLERIIVKWWHAMLRLESNKKVWLKIIFANNCYIKTFENYVINKARNKYCVKVLLFVYFGFSREHFILVLY